MIRKDKVTNTQLANVRTQPNYSKRGIDFLINQLRMVRPTGYGRYIACCPAHDDKNPSLAIQDHNGKILLKCFAGCDIYEIVSSIGMEVSDLFPESGEHRKPIKNPFPAADVLRCIQREALIITVTASRIINGTRLEKTDLERLILARNLIEAAYD